MEGEAVTRGRGPRARGGGGWWPARGSVSPGGQPAAARRRPAAVFVRGATAAKSHETAPHGFGIPGNTMGLATGTSARLRAGHDACRAPGSAARWGRAGRKLADAWAAVTCCEADDRVVHSAALRAATPRPLDATLSCHRRPTTTRRRPTAVSTGARRRHNGASVSRTLTEYSRATPHAMGVHHTRLRGRSQRMLRVHVEFDRSAAWTRLSVRLAQDRQPQGFN
jgi:hypothetical protein